MSQFSVRLSFDMNVPLEKKVYNAYKSLPRSRGQAFLRHCLEDGVNKAVKRFHVEDFMGANISPKPKKSPINESAPEKSSQKIGNREPTNPKPSPQQPAEPVRLLNEAAPKRGIVGNFFGETE